MNPIHTAILSYGMSGRIFHAPFIDVHPGFVFSAVTERHEKKVANAYPGVKSYTSVAELLDDPSIELVIVNTPNNTHFDLAFQSLSAGKHVLVEKPFAASSAQAKALFALSKKMGKQIMAYQNRRWDSDFLSVKQVIEEGRLGRLVEANFRFDRYKKELSPKKFKEEGVEASGLTYDLGPHLIDQVVSLFGKPLKSSKSTGCYRPDSVVDDYVSWKLLFPGNIQVNVTASLLTAAPVASFVLHGENGSYSKERKDIQEAQLDSGMKPHDPGYGIEPAGAEGTLTTMDEASHPHKITVPAPKGNYNLLFDAVYEQVRNNVNYPITEEEIITQLELLEQET